VLLKLIALNGRPEGLVLPGSRRALFPGLVCGIKPAPRAWELVLCPVIEIAGERRKYAVLRGDLTFSK